MCFVTSAKTLSLAVSASSSCRLAYLKLKAFGSESVSFSSESVSFASESVSIACELQPFPYGPAKAGCPLMCPSYPESGRGAKSPESPWCALAVVVKATQWLLFRVWQFCHFFMNSTAASTKGGTPCPQKLSVPRVALTHLLGTDPGLLGRQLVALCLLAWHLLLLT